MKKTISFYEWCVENDKKKLLKEWHPIKNNGLTPYDVSHSSNKKVWWLVNYHDDITGKDFQFEWEASPNDRKRGRDCPYLCSPPKMIYPGFNDLATVYPDLAEEWDPSNILPANKVIAGSAMEAKWICKNNPDHKWKVKISSRVHFNTGCPFCNASHGEKLINDILSKAGYKYEKEYRIKECAIQRPLPFDFAVFIKDKMYLIEYDGIQHFTPVDIFDGDKGLSIRKRNDRLKNDYCIEHNIPLLRIPYIIDIKNNSDSIQSIIFDFLNQNKIPDEIKLFYKSQFG